MNGTIFSIASGHGPNNGAATIDPVTGVWSYTPTSHFNGTDTFTVTVTDDDGHTATQVITATVTPVNDPTTIGGDISGSGAEDGGAITGTLTAADVDGLTDGTVFSIEAGDGASNGSVSVDPATGVWSYTPNAQFNGADTFTLTVTDDNGNATQQVINTTVTPVNDVPLISLSPSVDVTILDGLTPTLASSVTTTIADLDAYSSTLPDTFYFDVTVDTNVVGDQLLFESGGASFGISIFQQNTRLGVSVADSNNIDLMTNNVLSDNTRYGIVVELAVGNQLNIYLGELDASGSPVNNIELIASTTWSGSSDWTGTDDAGWGVLNGAQQGSTALSLINFAGSWHDGRFYSNQSTPQAEVTASANGGTLVYQENSGAQVVIAILK